MAGRQNSQTDVPERRIILFGGGEIYRIGLDCCDAIEATIVEDTSYDGVRFPQIDNAAWHDELLRLFLPLTAILPSFSWLTRIAQPAMSLAARRHIDKSAILPIHDNRGHAI